MGVFLIGHQPDVRQTTALIVIIGALSVLAYHLVENPIRHQRLPGLGGLRGLALWPVVLVLVLAVSGGAAGSYAQHRFDSRFQTRREGEAGPSARRAPHPRRQRRSRSAAPRSGRGRTDRRPHSRTPTTGARSRFPWPTSSTSAGTCGSRSSTATPGGRTARSACARVGTDGRPARWSCTATPTPACGCLPSTCSVGGTGSG